MNAQLHLGISNGRTAHECWQLYYHEGPVSVCLEVRHFWDGDTWDHFRVFAAHEDEQRNSNSHGYREVISHEERAERFETVLMHEGLEEAKQWERNADDIFYTLGKFNKIHRMANELKGRWEQICKLVAPSVNM